jgi:hypothetical protein
MSPGVQALPTLQLDISDGVYGGGPDGETILATSNEFTLYALLGEASLLNKDFTISASVYPLLGTPTNLGSFAFNGTTYDVTDDMIYGTPSGLPTHGAFPTYYLTETFQFTSGNTVGAYNTQDFPGGFDANYPGTDLYFAAFDVDVSGLAPGYYIHFDLFGTDLAGKFIKAPFSHDAQSNGAAPVPEPSTMLLLGLGLVGVAGLSRKHIKK